MGRREPGRSCLPGLAGSRKSGSRRQLTRERRNACGAVAARVQRSPICPDLAARGEREPGRRATRLSTRSSRALASARTPPGGAQGPGQLPAATVGRGRAHGRARTQAAGSKASSSGSSGSSSGVMLSTAVVRRGGRGGPLQTRRPPRGRPPSLPLGEEVGARRAPSRTA